MRSSKLTGAVIRSYILVYFTFVPMVINAEEEIAYPSVVTVSATYDSDDGHDYYLDANVGLPEGQRFILSVGKLKITTSDSDQQLEPINALIGVSSNPQASVPLGVELEYWEEDTDIKVSVNTLRGSVGYHAEEFIS